MFQTPSRIQPKIFTLSMFENFFDGNVDIYFSSFFFISSIMRYRIHWLANELLSVTFALIRCILSISLRILIFIISAFRKSLLYLIRSSIAFVLCLQSFASPRPVLSCLGHRNRVCEMTLVINSRKKSIFKLKR